MRTFWPGPLVLALCLSPALADAREEGRDRGGRRSDGNRRYDGRDHGRYEPRGHTRYDYRSAPRRGWPVFRYHLHRYPAYYRQGYIHLHGYYYPRYYYDYGAYDTHASIRLLVEPREAEVYVDGYYAGLVDDFDGIFQRLHVTPGPHDITLRLPGFQTWSIEVYATPDRTINVHHDMIPGPSGAVYGDQPYEEPGSTDEYGYDGP